MVGLRGNTFWHKDRKWIELWRNPLIRWDLKVQSRRNCDKSLKEKDRGVHGGAIRRFLFYRWFDTKNVV